MPTSLLAELIAIPSVHPEADTGGTPSGEGAIAAHVAKELRLMGADVETPLLAPGRPSVVAVFEPRGTPIGTVMFAPHLDTVGVHGMSVPPFQLTRRAGRLYGRGACDTKGPLAALLWAFRKWTRSSARARGQIRWVIAASAGEEQGSLGAQALTAAGLRADFAIALEPTRLRVVHAAKGVLRLWIEVSGRSAHGAQPARGRNAIEKLLPLAAAIFSEMAPRLGLPEHPVLGPATVNLGIIQGGGELNIVPDYCRVGLDIRIHPKWTDTDVLSYMHGLLRRTVPDAKLSIHRRGPPFVLDRRNVWAARLRRHGRGWETADWFCDANVFAAQGMPAVAFGPGSIAQAHTHDEFIDEEELRQGACAYHAFLSDLDRAG